MKSFITYLTEKKDHIIKRLKNLTDDEKDQVIAFFSKKPNLENKINWNNRELTFKDFQGVMDTSKTERKRQVKKQGIAGLRKGKDYLELDLPGGFTAWNAYIPLHHEASRLIASKKIGGVEGKWCISANDIRDWKEYVYDDNLIPIMFVQYEDKEKYALMIDGETLSFESLWDQKDKSLGRQGAAEFGLDIDTYNSLISGNTSILRKVRTSLDKNKPKHWFEDGVREGNIKVLNPKYNIDEDDLVMWESGTWKGGTWEEGIWWDGTWEKGTWEKGTWWSGTWVKGLWKGGTWKDGIFEDGTWEGGTWEGGTWFDGTWEGGTWFDGTWEGGYDKYGNYHEKGDSPDKW